MTVLAIVGPTAAGKSELAVSLARGLGARGRAAELIAIDAFTVYRGMDIGTATPPAALRAEIPHHLVDVLEPSESLTVARFQRLARRAIAEVLAREAVPVLVGGSGLYWRAVVDPLRFPPTEQRVRERLERRWRSDPSAAHAELARHDPAAAAGIAPENLRRTIRALEVLELTGEPFSAFDDGFDRYTSIYADLEVAYLEPDAEVLRARIHERAVAMVDAGLLDEARALRRGPELSRTARQAIGYAEAFAVLDGELDAAELPASIAHRTWRFAKRQRSWFRADPRCEVTDAEQVVARWTT